MPTGEISLYFHIPFCLKKCPYCHFYSVYPSKELVEKYTSSVLTHLDQTDLKHHKIVSIYFGGGTPTLLPSTFFKKILSKISNQTKVVPNCEITIEANPFQITLQQFKALKKTGINRLSLGVQSFDDQILKILQRKHSACEAEKSVHLAYEAGFTNISIDLMYDIPTQSEKTFTESVLKATKLPITHISLYNLVFEENTPFFKKKAKLEKLLLNEKASLNGFQKALTLFRSAGFQRYEISAFAKDNLVSKHNLGYWTGRPFLGFGPSAFSYMQKSRFQNCPDLNAYCRLIQTPKKKGDLKKKPPISFSETLKYPDDIRELLAINLRVLNGVDLKEFKKNNGPLDIETLKRVEKLKSQKLLVLDKRTKKLRLSSKGILFYDLVATEII